MIDAMSGSLNEANFLSHLLSLFSVNKSSEGSGIKESFKRNSYQTESKLNEKENQVFFSQRYPLGKRKNKAIEFGMRMTDDVRSPDGQLY